MLPRSGPAFGVAASHPSNPSRGRLYGGRMGWYSGGKGDYMKKLSLLIVFFFLNISLFAVTFSEWLSHCNFAWGFPFPLGSEKVGSQSFDMSLTDGYGDTYYFHCNPGEGNSALKMLGLEFSLGLPVYYYKEYFSTGVQGEFILNGIFNTSSTMYFYGGLYAEGKYKRFALRGSIGFSAVHVESELARLKAAWRGDPGYYAGGGKWVDPGEALTASATEYLGLSSRIGLKYYPFVYKTTRKVVGFYIELSYFYAPGKTINAYGLNLGKANIDAPLSLPSFEVKPAHNIGLLFGLGR
jgi:hypothetical protein